MAQVVATRLIHGAFAPSPSSASVQSRSEKLKPYSGFALKVLVQPEKSSRRGGIRVSMPVSAIGSSRAEPEVIPVTPEDVVKVADKNQYMQEIQQLENTSVGMWSKPTVRRKTKIVCTIGPSTNTKEMIWKLAEAGMNVARLNMSHGDHASHQKVIDLVKDYNTQTKDNDIAVLTPRVLRLGAAIYPNQLN